MPQPAPGRDHVSALDGHELGEKNGIDGKPVAFGGLNHVKPAVQKFVQAFTRTQVCLMGPG